MIIISYLSTYIVRTYAFRAWDVLLGDYASDRSGSARINTQDRWPLQFKFVICLVAPGKWKGSPFLKACVAQLGVTYIRCGEQHTFFFVSSEYDTQGH